MHKESKRWRERKSNIWVKKFTSVWRGTIVIKALQKGFPWAIKLRCMCSNRGKLHVWGWGVENISDLISKFNKFNQLINHKKLSLFRRKFCFGKLGRDNKLLLDKSMTVEYN